MSQLKDSKERSTKIAPKHIATFGCVLFLSVAGCATAPVPPDLVDARSSYHRAQSGPAAQYGRAKVSEAKIALDKAEAAYLDDPGGQKTKDLAHAAREKTALAEANATSAQTRNLDGQAPNDVDETSKGELAQARGQLISANALLARRERQLVAERQESADSDKRAQDAMNRLAATTTSTVTQESRGTVITLSGGALFASNKDTLLPGAQDGLGQIAEALKAQGDHEIIVEGHTDSQGSPVSNQAISDRRARSVVNYLISRGVSGDQIRAEGFGQKRPIADNASAEGRAINRRLEIVVMAADHH